MRLIDADELKKYPAWYAGQKEIFDAIVDAQPTAYDVDKVVEQLITEANVEIVLHCGRCNGKTLALGFREGIKKAIDIVRNGGKE